MQIEDVKGMIHSLIQTDIGSGRVMNLQVKFDSPTTSEVKDVRFEVNIDQIETYGVVGVKEDIE